MYDRLSIRRIPTFAGLMLMFCALLLSAGAVTPAFASERSTGQEEVRFQQSVVRQQMTPTISIASDSTYVAGLADLEFTLTREGDLTESLRVIVEIEQDQTWLSATSYSVTFEAGVDETDLTLAANIFSTEIMEDGELTASVGRCERLRCIGRRGYGGCCPPGGPRFRSLLRGGQLRV